ncbi:Kinetochore-associated protein MTW1 [Smittium culicis]|uniref:Kinetochore-associated protein MTW1 n=1 Tax=Smittium culicis TaxID=133412 RepID=A0A1R1XR82_9FUNG|nr:Kinetochore-associated protein MTW1 [Smittium culicis]
MNQVKTQRENDSEELVKDLGTSAKKGKLEDRQGKKKFKMSYPPNQKIYEIVVENFEFIPLKFIDQIINAVTDGVLRITKLLSEFVEAELGDGIENEEAINRIETFLEYSADKNFDKFELYALRNIFNINEGLENYINSNKIQKNLAAATEEDINEALLKIEKSFKEIIIQRAIEKKLLKNIEEIDSLVKRLSEIESDLKTTFCYEESIVDGSILSPDKIKSEIKRLFDEVEKLESIGEEIEKYSVNPKIIQQVSKQTDVDAFINFHVDNVIKQNQLE